MTKRSSSISAYGCDSATPTLHYIHLYHAVQGWQLILTGHSLGAGVACLLALKMRRSFPSSFSWGFCPPGGMVTSRLAHYMAPFCISLVLGKVWAVLVI